MANASDFIERGGELKSLSVFTSSGTWNKPSGVEKVKIIVTGGGSSSNSAGNFGSAAGTAIKVLDVTNINSATIIVGSGGSSGTDETGGDSQWDDGTNVITGQGGRIKYDEGGVGTGGDINIYGGSSMKGDKPSGPASFWGGGNSSYAGGGAFGSAGSENYDGLNGIVYVEEY